MEDKLAVTFVNEDNLSSEQIRDIFNKYGPVRFITTHKKRAFVHFGSESAAENALNNLRDEFKAEFAWKRASRGKNSNVNDSVKDNDNKSGNGCEKETAVGDNQMAKLLNMKYLQKGGSMKFIKAQDCSLHEEINQNGYVMKTRSLPRLSTCYSSCSSLNCSKSLVLKEENIKFESDQLAKDAIVLPPLIDVKKMPKLYSIILGNLPEHYTLEDVNSLVEEVKPAAFTEIDVTSCKKLKYCEIHVRDEVGIKYLREKLHGFVICGKKLVAVEPSALLSGTKFDL